MREKMGSPWRSHYTVASRAWVSALLLSLALLLFPRSALAVTCVNGTDCDGNGVNNFSDPCPALEVSGNPSGSTLPDSLVVGFRDIACYEPFVPSTPGCIPVAARPFDEFVPDDPYKPTGATTRHVGFTFVGVYDVSAGGAAAALSQAPAADVAGAHALGHAFPPTSLYACMGSVEFAPAGDVLHESPIVYGFQAVANYVLSIADSARMATRLNLAPFVDALGLVTDVRAPPSNPTSTIFLPAIVGNVGVIYDTGNLGKWGIDPSVVQQAASADLPQAIQTAIPVACLSAHLPSVRRTPLGFAAIVPAGTLVLPTPVTQPRAPGEFVDPGTVVMGSDQGACAHATEAQFVFAAPNSAGQQTSPGIAYPLEFDSQYGWSRAFPGFRGPLTCPLAVDVATSGFVLSIATPNLPTFDLRAPRPSWAPPFRSVPIPSFNSSRSSSLLLSPNTSSLDWTLVQGYAASAIFAVQFGAHPISTFSQADTNGQISIATRLLGWDLVTETYDYTTGSWKYSYRTYDQEPVELSATLPTPPSDVAALDLSQPSSDVFLAVHFLSDPFHPAGDYWEANGTSSACMTLSTRFPGVIAANPTVTTPDDWCLSKTQAAVQPVADYAARVDMCKFGKYDPGDADAHWPLIQNRVPYAGIYGQFFPPPDSRAKAHFASDLAHAGIFATNRLHEGMDINWEWKEPAADPQSAPIFANYDPTYCYGALASGPFLDGKKAQLAVPCDDDMFKLCGKLADNGCNPAEQYWERWKHDESEACSCHKVDCGWFSWFCTGIVCAGKELTECVGATIINTARLAYDDATAYAGVVCALFQGSACGSGSYSLYRVKNEIVPGKREMEHELEYNIAFGAHDIGFGYVNDCASGVGPSNCEFDDYKPIRNWSMFQDQSVVTVDEDLNANGTSGAWPFVLGPGLFQSPEGVWGNMALTAGQRSSANDFPAVIQVLPDDVLATRPTTQADPDRGFRMEELGDLIVDCGHNPLRTELHPVSAALLHLGGKKTRYSLFGWHRFAFDRQTTYIVDLWPSTPKPSANARVRVSVPFDGGIVVGPQERLGTWLCTPFPDRAPDRVRCAMVPGNGTLNEDCENNIRMRPACLMDVAGGLVDVDWTQDPCSGPGGACDSNSDCCSHSGCSSAANGGKTCR